MVLKKLPDGSWKCFRGMGGPTFTAPRWQGKWFRDRPRRLEATEASAADLAAIEKLHQQDIAATVVARSCGDGGSVDR